jgi:hypothetical protein
VPELPAALVAAPFTVVVAVITAWATLKVHSIRRERRVNLILPRLDVYKTLWSLMDEVTRAHLRHTDTELSEPKLLERDECKKIAEELNKWYFSEGKGIFLSPKARDQFMVTKHKLLTASNQIPLQTLLEEFSD